MSTRTLITAALAVVFIVTPVTADWDPGDGHKMHWPQLPDLEQGMDVLAGLTLEPFPAPVIKFLADDFRCTQTGPITDIHIWGSWLNDFWPDPGAIPGAHGTFVLALYDDVPAVPGGPHSMPGDLLWQQVFKPGQYVARNYAPSFDEQFYDPNIQQVLGFDNTVWQYNFFIDEALALVQERDKIYWLAVANVDPNNDGILNLADVSNALAGQHRFGWKTSRDHWNDDAVFIDTFYDPAGLPPEFVEPPLPSNLWHELRHPLTGESLDLAFVITPEPATLALLTLSALAVLRKR